jgi:hypothetical protein
MATRHGWPRPVVWLLWLVGALVGSVVLGFLAGLARPREPDPWSYGPDPDRPAPDTHQVETSSSDSSPLPSEDE